MKEMAFQTKICHLCGATFVVVHKNQQYCDECLKVQSAPENLSATGVVFNNTSKWQQDSGLLEPAVHAIEIMKGGKIQK